MLGSHSEGEARLFPGFVTNNFALAAVRTSSPDYVAGVTPRGYPRFVTNIFPIALAAVGEFRHSTDGYLSGGYPRLFP
jgi:hypothetical protein